jgi:hypothetical protein
MELETIKPKENSAVRVTKDLEEEHFPIRDHNNSEVLEDFVDRNRKILQCFCTNVGHCNEEKGDRKPCDSQLTFLYGGEMTCIFLLLCMKMETEKLSCQNICRHRWSVCKLRTVKMLSEYIPIIEKTTDLKG